MFKQFILAFAIVVLCLPFQAHAHFQMLYTPDLLKSRGGNIVLKMPFTHPAANGYVMAVDAPHGFFHLKKGKQQDLLSKLQEISWSSADNTGKAYEAQVALRGLGDNIFVLTMAPYFEANEGAYIQQITKTIVNVGSLPTDWEQDLGLDAEIVPLTKPYAIYAGGSFTGVVKSRGKAVPFAEIEVEYVNYLPEMNANRFASQARIEPPADAFITMTLYADANGTFTFGLPKAGHWGFAALGVGAETEHAGKPLSQDAVIWVQAHELR